METFPETTETPERDAKRLSLRPLASRIASWRASRAVTAEERADQARLVRLRQDQERQREQEAASQAAVSRRRAARATEGAEREDEIAPVPQWMQVTGVWFDRTFGSLPLIAPLVVSGYFTMQAGTSAPLNMFWPIALAFTLGLEGSLWYLARIYEKTRIEGDSTVNLRLGMFGIVALITSVIAGHEYWKATGTTQLIIFGFDVTSTLTSVVAVALMALVGIFVNAKRAAFKHRVKLRRQGLIDARAPKFSAMAWLLCPWETAWSLKHATRYRISSPILAVEDRRLWIASDKPKVWPPVETVEAEIVSETRPAQRLRAVPSPVPAETPRLSPVSTLRPALPVSETNPETEDETEIVSGPLTREQKDEQAGRLAETGLSCSQVGERVNCSRAEADRRIRRYRASRLRDAGDASRAAAN